MKNFGMRSPAQKKMHEMYYNILRPLFTYYQIEITLFHCIDGVNYILDVNDDQYFITSLEMLETCLSELQHARKITSYNTNSIDYALIGSKIELHSTAGVGVVWGLSTEIEGDEVGYEVRDCNDGSYDLILHTQAPANSSDLSKAVYVHNFSSVISLKRALDNRLNWASFRNNEVSSYAQNEYRRVTLNELDELIQDEKDMLESLYPTE